MVCIYCGQETQVVNSRSGSLGQEVWRRRRCKACLAPFTTTESYALDKALMVEGKNKKVKPFCRDELFMSVLKATEHLKGSLFIANQITNTIIQKLIAKKPLNPVISSQTIIYTAGLVLKRFDAAASIKYLSFYSSTKLPKDVKQLLKG